MFFHEDLNSFEFTNLNSFEYLSLQISDFAAVNNGLFLVPVVDLLAISCDNLKAGFSALNAARFKRPFLPLVSDDTTETIIELTYFNGVDSILLGNINFSSFTIDINGDQQAYNAIQNAATGRYDGRCFFDVPGCNSIKLIIPSQTPLDSASYFYLGAVAGGNRIQINPWYSIKANIEENFHNKRFDYQNTEVVRTGRSGHIVEFINNFLTQTETDNLEQIIAGIDETEALFVYQKISTDEILLLLAPEGDIPQEQFTVNYHSLALKYREFI